MLFIVLAILLTAAALLAVAYPILSRSSTSKPASTAQESLDEHAKLSFVRGARITPVRLGDRGPLIGAGAVAVRGIHRTRRARSSR